MAMMHTFGSKHLPSRVMSRVYSFACVLRGSWNRGVPWVSRGFPVNFKMGVFCDFLNITKINWNSNQLTIYIT